MSMHDKTRKFFVLNPIQPSGHISNVEFRQSRSEPGQLILPHIDLSHLVVHKKRKKKNKKKINWQPQRAALCLDNVLFSFFFFFSLVYNCYIPPWKHAFFSFSCCQNVYQFHSLGDSNGHHSPPRWQSTCSPSHSTLFSALHYFQRPPSCHLILYLSPSTSSPRQPPCQVTLNHPRHRPDADPLWVCSCSSPTSHGRPTCRHVYHVSFSFILPFRFVSSP